jgi:hypothetical protein
MTCLTVEDNAILRRVDAGVTVSQVFACEHAQQTHEDVEHAFG